MSIDVPEAREIIASVLYYVPEFDSDSKKIDKKIQILEVSNTDGWLAKYSVQHYPTSALGDAFGPLAFDDILRFCRRLARHLASLDFAPLYLTTPKADPKAHTNVSVLLGAYLVLMKSWSAKQVANVLGPREAQRHFNCSWKKLAKDAAPNMLVMHCWEGLYTAVQQKWITPSSMIDDTRANNICTGYRRMAKRFDAAWIIPGRLMVSADPVTTAYDPNPETFRSIWTSENAPPKETTENKQRASDIKMSLVSQTDEITEYRLADGPSESTIIEMSAGDVDTDYIYSGRSLGERPVHPSAVSAIRSLQGDVVDVQDDVKVQDKDIEKQASEGSGNSVKKENSGNSVETVCKEYGVEISDRDLSPSYQVGGDSFVSFLRDSGIRRVIRSNFSDEEGMPTASYRRSQFQETGIGHSDIQIVDTKGGLPKGPAVAKVLEAGGSIRQEPVLVHCKGGFGRSVVLACLLVIKEYDVPGSVLLGWARIARPGAVTTPQQEAFLMSLKGRGDVLRFAGLAEEGGQKCCSVL